jgi:hypothetical protein
MVQKSTLNIINQQTVDLGGEHHQHHQQQQQQQQQQQAQAPKQEVNNVQVELSTLQI